MAKEQTMKGARLLQHNPEPIKIVDAAQRDVWMKLPGFRCDHEDGRGRCTSHETRSIVLSSKPLVVGAYCARHIENHEDWATDE